MSYQLDLDEFTDIQLLQELYRRARLLVDGKCSYCSRVACNCRLRQQKDRIRDFTEFHNQIRRMDYDLELLRRDRDKRVQQIYEIPANVNWNVFGAKTGRTSCETPNIVEKEKE